MNMASIRRISWIRYALAAIVIGVLATVYHIFTVEGGSTAPKLVMIRMEDIGPGGEYDSLERLGKLRAVFDYLTKHDVPFHMAIIPRWNNITPDGTRYDTALNQTDDPYVQSFDLVLKQAIRDGAVAGMHGYTHQVGYVRRDDGHHESGIGNEFNVPDVLPTMTTEYAIERVSEGMKIMESADIRPMFWEVPHYHSTPEQDNVFRSFFGLHYQAEVQMNRNAPQALYLTNRNTGFGASSLGAAYVPTPFDYIAYNKDEKVILDRLGKSNNIGSFFYHPFLEFKHLLPVLDEAGEPLLRDGIPVFTYPVQIKSTLQKLIAGIETKGYSFYSILDYVPFTPAHSVPLKARGKDNGAAAAAKAGKGASRSVKEPQDTMVLLGDVSGDGQTDTVRWDHASGDIYVTACDFRTQRNTRQQPVQIWSNVPYVQGAAASLADVNGDRADDLLVVQPSGKLELYLSDRTGSLTLERRWTIAAGGWQQLETKRLKDGRLLLAGLSSDRKVLHGILLSGEGIKPLKPYVFKGEAKNEPLPYGGPLGEGMLFMRKDSSNGNLFAVDTAQLVWSIHKVELGVPAETGRIKFGDFDGDKLQDIVRWDTKTNQYTVYIQQREGSYEKLSTFGPWGKQEQRLYIADLDGNGKDDLAVTSPFDSFLDTALSFETGHHSN